MFNQNTFCGASVHSIQSNIGWNGEASKLVVNLFEDASNGDSFTIVEGDEGTPVYFSFGAYRFYGLIEKFEKANNSQVNPGYTVYCTDPRILLSNTKLILANYTGVTSSVSNLLNIYGYWENFGFGTSLVNDSGMPWNLIKSGILAITGGTAGSFGGPISYKGYTYSLDLSELPGLPNYFRVGGDDGSNLSVMDFIEICCQTAGCDYFVELTGLQIKIRVVTRVSTLTAGVLNAWVSGFSGSTLVSKTIGSELRNDPNSTFLVGGKVLTLYKVPYADNAATFWGFDANNQAILGSLRYFKFKRTALDYTIGNNGTGYVATDVFTLWLPQLTDILGTPYYECSDFELRLVLGRRGGSDWNVWLDFIKTFKPTIHSLLNNYGGMNNLGNNQLLNNPTPDAMANDRPGANDRIKDIQAMAAAAGNMNDLYQVKRLFAELKMVAETYLNKTYAVRLPQVSSYVESETSLTKYSYDIAPAGYVDSAGDNDLNSLPALYHQKFQTTDGLFEPFVYYPNAAPISDTENINPSTSLIYSDHIYDKCEVIEKFASYNSLPYAIVKTNTVTYPPDSFWGSDDDYTVMINAKFVDVALTPPSGSNNNIVAGQNDTVVGDMPKRLAFSSINQGIAPVGLIPTYFHIPLQSNTLRYGPWYAQGAPGNTVYQQRDDLVPWAYGGYTVLNLVGAATVSQSSTAQQSVATANVVIADVPAYNLGDLLQAGGPNLTRINVSYGASQGVTTTYSIETFVNRPGTISKYNLDRIKRSTSLSRQAANNAKRQFLKNSVLADQLRGGSINRQPFDLFPKTLKLETPHYVMVGRIENMVSGTNLVGACLSTIEEGFIAANINNDTEFSKGAMVSLDSLYCPYAYGGTTVASGMPWQRAVTGVWTDTTILQGDSNQIFKTGPNNIRIIAYGSGTTNTYNGAHAYYNNLYGNYPVSGTQRRAMASRAPLILVGWGRNIDGTVTVGSGDTFAPDYMTNTSDYRVGPVDLLYDQYRQTWTSHDVMKGITKSTVPSGSSGTVRIRKSASRTTQSALDQDAGYDITAWNWFSTNVASGTKVLISYVANDNKWYVSSADCG